MRHPLRVLALACALACTPACAALKLGGAEIANPIAAARTLDQSAYALLQSYAALVEEAADIVRDPATPLSVKRALGRAEAFATPAAETLAIAVGAYVRAEIDYAAANRAEQNTLARVTSALEIASRRLRAAIAAAQAPIGELETLIRAQR